MAMHDFRYLVFIVVLVPIPFFLPAQSRSSAPDQGWKVRFEGSQSRPVIRNDTLYIGSLDGSLYAFDIKNGQKLWDYGTGQGLSSGTEVIVVPAGTDLATQMNLFANRPLRDRKKEIQGTPAILGDKLWVGSEDFSLYMVDVLSGEKIWTFETGGRVNTRPIVIDEIVAFVSEDGLLYGLDRLTGEKKLEAESYPGAKLVYSQPGPFPNPPNQPVFNGEEIYLTNWVRGAVKKVHVSSISIVSGEYNWEVGLEGWDVQDPILVDDLLLVLYVTNESSTDPSYMRVCALDAATGEAKWTFDQKTVYGFKNFSADSQSVYFESPTGLFVLDKHTGALRWQYLFDEKKINLPERSYYVHDGVYLVDHGSLLKLDPKTGNLEKTMKVDRHYRIFHLEKGIIYGTSFKQVQAIDLSSGKTLWAVRTNTELSSRPVYHDQMIYFTTNSVGYVGMSRVDQGYLYAVNGVTGR